MIDIKVPTVGESINEVTLLKWVKKDGDYVERDEVIAELESEKATFEVNAEKAGILKTAAQEGDTLKIGDLLASIDDAAAKPASDGSAVAEKKEEKKKKVDKAAVKEDKAPIPVAETNLKATPVASAIIADKHVDASTIAPSGFGGKILKEDVLAALANPGKVTGGKALFNREERKEKMNQLRKTI